MKSLKKHHRHIYNYMIGWLVFTAPNTSQPPKVTAYLKSQILPAITEKNQIFTLQKSSR